MTLSVTAPWKSELNEGTGHLSNAHYQRTWLPCPNVGLKIHQDGFGPEVEDEGGEHTSCHLQWPS